MTESWRLYVSFLDLFAYLFHEAMEKIHVVEGQELKWSDLVCFQQMRNVSPAVILAHKTGALRVERFFVGQKRFLFQIKLSL